jgi:hypothetical protein
LVPPDLARRSGYLGALAELLLCHFFEAVGDLLFLENCVGFDKIDRSLLA